MKIKEIQLLILLTVLASKSSGQSLRAMFLNSNVYRSWVDIKAVRLIDKKLGTIYNDTTIVKADITDPIDYKIINEDENGYVIIRILPKVKVLQEIIGNKMIQVLRKTSDDQNKDDTDNGYNYYFAVKKDSFQPLSKTLLSSKIVGVPLVHPFKLRPDKDTEGWDLTGDFTVSYNFGVRLKLNKNPFTQNFLTIVPFGFGIGAAKYFKKNNDGTLTEKQDSFAVNYYQGGILLTLQKVNIGVFTGVDAMIDKRKDWFYQGQQWFSFGLGYKFKTD